MTRQWIRKAEIIISGGGKSLNVSDMRVRIEIQDTTLQTPRIAAVRITNLSESTAQRIKGEGSVLTISAGYVDGYGQIFKGDIKQKRIGRETPTDTYVDILAATHDRAYNYGMVSRTLPAGSSALDVYKECLKPYQKFGVTQGQVADRLGSAKFPRPYTMFGLARDHLRTLAYTNQCNWNINGDALNVIPVDGALEGGVTILNSRTGLIGLPVQTELGVTARCLINPALRIDAKVKIDQKSVQQATLNLSAANGFGSGPLNQEPYLPSVAVDGLYRIIALNVIADTRSQPWYYDLTLIRSAGALNEAQVQAGFGIPITPLKSGFVGPN